MSNLSLRLIAAAIGIPLLLFCAVVGGVWLVILIAAIQVLILLEWQGLTKTMNVSLRPFVLAFAILGIDLILMREISPALFAGELGIIYLWLLLSIFDSSRKPLLQLGLGSLYLVYVAVPLALWLPISELTESARFGKLGALGILLAATWMCDSGAYFFGRAIGKHKLYPAASPNKTVEGAIGGVIGAGMILPLLRLFNLASPRLIDYAMIPICVGVCGQIGDLIESLMKREAGLKDSSKLIPGHGGFLDRFDSLLLSTPIYFAFLKLTAN